MFRTVTHVTLSNETIEEVEIIRAHTEGILHRAFSVYVFNPEKTKILLQKRSGKKMLWPGYTANTCCSHPRGEEDIVKSGERRLEEEMGFTTKLTLGPAFVYRAEDPFGNGIEHEYDILLLGTTPESMVINPNPEEAESCEWVSIELLKNCCAQNDKNLTPWLILGFPKILTSAAFATLS